MKTIVLLFLKVVTVLVFVTSCTVESVKNKHYARKYGTLIASDIALAYVCKTALVLGTPICIGADLLADIVIVTYHNKQYNKAKKKLQEQSREVAIEKARANGEVHVEQLEEKEPAWKEFLIDFGMFLSVYILLP